MRLKRIKKKKKRKISPESSEEELEEEVEEMEEEDERETTLDEQEVTDINTDSILGEYVTIESMIEEDMNFMETEMLDCVWLASTIFRNNKATCWLEYDGGTHELHGNWDVMLCLIG